MQDGQRRMLKITHLRKKFRGNGKTRAAVFYGSFTMLVAFGCELIRPSGTIPLSMVKGIRGLDLPQNKKQPRCGHPSCGTRHDPPFFFSFCCAASRRLSDPQDKESSLLWPRELFRTYGYLVCVRTRDRQRGRTASLMFSSLPMATERCRTHSTSYFLHWYCQNIVTEASIYVENWPWHLAFIHCDSQKYSNALRNFVSTCIYILYETYYC